MSASARAILLSLPMLLTSTTDANSRNETATELTLLEDTYKKFIAENEALLERYTEVEEKLQQLEHRIADTDLDKNDIGLNLKEFESEYEKLVAEKEDILKRRVQFEEKLRRSNHSFTDEYTRNYKLETLNKTLLIYNDPSIILRNSIDDGPLLNGYTVWGSALVLAKYLELSCVNKSWVRGKKVLDLGAGTGYVGIVAACLGGDVTVTDLSPMLPFLQKNIDANLKQLEGTGGKLHAQVLRWGDAGCVKPIPKQDIILLSNVVYYNESIEPLVSTMVALSNKGTKLIACQENWSDEEHESVWNSFNSYASEYFKLSSISPNGLDIECGSGDVWLLQGHFR